MKKITIVVLAMLALTIGACRNQAAPSSQQSTTPQQAQAAAQQPAPHESALVPPTLPEIIGSFHPNDDGTEFVAVLVPNECGTVGKPTDCIVKEIEVSTPPYSIYGVAISSYYIDQVTFELQEGGYETFTCVNHLYGTSLHEEPIVWNCDDKELFVAGQKFRMGRKHNILSFRQNDGVAYFLSLGKCASVHECQDLARQAILPNFYWLEIPSDAWKRYHDYEARQEQLNTPR